MYWKRDFQFATMKTNEIYVVEGLSMFNDGLKHGLFL